MNPPDKHHYIPKFYLKQWADNDGKLCQFSKPYKNIVIPRRVHPSQTGYVKRLYELKDWEPELAQQIETKFFSPVDSGAAQALQHLLSCGGKSTWAPSKRTAWSRFLLSLLLRCPEDIEIFRNKWYADFYSTNDKTDALYENIRTEDSPKTFAEYLKETPQEKIELDMFTAYMKLVDNKRIGQRINNMIWEVLDLTASKHNLFTSDRPLIRSNGIDGPNGHMAIPIGPHQLFIAFNSQQYLNEIKCSDPSALVAECNNQIVGSAVKFVYSTTDKSKRFVSNRMGKLEQPRVVESILNDVQSELDAFPSPSTLKIT